MGDKVYQREDGTTYFVIGSGSSASSAHLVVVDTISERNVLPNTGMVLVRKAYLGDDTVHRGWALYIVDPDTLNTVPHKWIKIAEQESVDGPWGVNEELLSVLVQTKDFTAFKNQINEQLANYDALFNKVEGLVTDTHAHLNKDVLDKLSVEAGVLKLDGKTVGSTYIYDNVDSDQGIFWENPNDTEDRCPVLNSHEIAKKLIANGLVALGQAIRVTEIDYAVSEYIVAKNEAGELTAYFRGRIGGGNPTAVVHHATALPVNVKEYLGQGYWFLLKSDGSHLPNKFYTVVKNGSDYEWKAIEEIVPVPDPTVKPEILTCFKTNMVDLGTTVKIAWKDPELVSGPDGNIKWNRTVVVRRFGQAPESHNDGTIVVETDAHNLFAKKCFVDAIPFVKQPAFYGVFSQTMDGVWYKGSVAEAILPTWEYFKNQAQRGLAALNFEIGDIVVAPAHDQFGIMEYEVTKTEDDGDVYLMAKCALATLPYDGREFGMVPTKDTVYQEGKTYFRVESTDSSHQLYYQLEVNRDYMVGESCVGMYERPVNPAFDVGTGVAHGSCKWPHSNLKLWLNSNVVGDWFVKQNDWDKVGFEQPKGFLAGFQDENFKACIRSVMLPDTTTGDPSSFIKQLITGAECIWWTMEMDTSLNKVKVYDEEGNSSFVYPESQEVSVVPVIQIGARSGIN